MVISEIGIRGFKSYGNNEQVLKLNEDGGELILLVGENGSGKCVEKNTTIEVDFQDLEITEGLIELMGSTELGKKIFLYIEERNPPLYEKIKIFKDSKCSN